MNKSFFYGVKMIGKYILCFLAVIKAGYAGLFNPHTFTLKNGLQVIVVENHRTNIVSQSVWYKVGSADDPFGKTGLAHYLEHMMFKGTEGSPSVQYAEYVSRIGGSYNATTRPDVTNYYATVASEYLETIVALEAGRMRHLEVVNDQADTERNVILEERNMRYENNPVGRLIEIINARFYYNHPYRLPGIGWEHEIKTLTAEDVRQFHRKWYAPNNAILIFAGDITLSKARMLAEKYYSNIPSRTLEPRQRLQEPPHPKTLERLVFKAKEIKVPYLLRAYQGPNFETDNGKHTFPVQVLSYLLQIKPWGILHKSLVEDTKTASFAQILHTPCMRDESSFILVLQPLTSDHLAAGERILDQKLAQIITEGIPAELVERAKRQLIAGTVFAHDHSTAGAEETGEGVAIDMPLEDIDGWIENIKAVTVEQVNTTARWIFRKEHHLTAHLLPQIETATDQSSK